MSLVPYGAPDMLDMGNYPTMEDWRRAMGYYLKAKNLYDFVVTNQDKIREGWELFGKKIEQGVERITRGVTALGEAIG